MVEYLPWLVGLVAFLALLIIPTMFYERYCRSEYFQYQQYQRALEAQRDCYVPPVREYPVHQRTIVRAGIVK